MARCPFAVQRILPENANQPRITPRVVILHRAVDGRVPNQSIYPLFSTSGNDLESHFFVFDNGTIEQYMDTEVQADANYKANGFAVSIETEDDGVERPWTQEQCDAIVRLVSWLCATHSIPRVLCPRWDGAGIGWHVQFGAPGAWTPSVKTCPGPYRIEQIKSVIIPRVSEDDMPTLDEIYDMPVKREDDPNLNATLRGIVANTDKNWRVLNELARKVDSLQAGKGPTADQVVDSLLARLRGA